MRHFAAISLCTIFFVPALSGVELRVPAATAYLDPDVGGARVSRRNITRWTDPKLKVVWFDQLKRTGELDASLVLRLPLLPKLRQ